MSPPATTGGSKSGFFQEKVFGVKTWQLMLGLTIAILAWALYKQRKSAASATTSATTTAASGTTNATYTPPYVIQTDVNEAPVNNSSTTNVSSGPANKLGGPPPRTRHKRTPPPSTPPPSSPPQSGPVTQPVGPAAPPTLTPPPQPQDYTVVAGDNYTSIADKFGVFQNTGNPGLSLYEYQLTPGLRPASTQATIQSRGPNLLYSGGTVVIPPT